ncbi:hypothetical protein M413DRAFT_438609, partial [Hebeloma cylindrosporum]
MSAFNVFSKEVKPRTLDNPDRTKEILRAFIKHNPNTQYTFDSERGSSESELCREGGRKGRECITLKMTSKELFEAMQSYGFFCALPMEPGRTYMSCKPGGLPK